MQALTQSYNASGLKLYRTLSGTPGNLVLSPYSIGTALAMAYAGARGATEREMAATLGLGPRTAVDAANAALLEQLEAYSRAGGRSAVALTAANALVLPKGKVGVAAAYAALLRASYAAEVIEAGSAADINAWVAGRTGGRIGDIVDDLPPGPTLVNAVHLKAAWGSPFDPSDTKDGDFSLTAAKRVRVPMMHQQEDFALVVRPGYRAVWLPYAEPSLGLVVVLPDAVEGLAGVADRLDAVDLKSLLASLQNAPPSQVALALPRFKASLSADLVPPLQAAGMRLAFGDGADFTGVTGDGPRVGGLKIEVIRHRAVIEVDEHGAEAAAATGVVMAPTSAAPEPRPRVDFVVDRPFLFLVVDKASGVVMFQGRVADPSRRD